MNRRKFLEAAIAALVAPTHLPVLGEEGLIYNQLKREMFTITSSETLTFTIPSSNKYPIGTHIHVINPSDDAMVVKMDRESNQTIHSYDKDANHSTNEQSIEPHGLASIVKHSNNVWVLWGELADLV